LADDVPEAGGGSAFGRGWLPYLAPTLLFGLMVELGSRSAGPLQGALLLGQVLLPAGALLYFWRRGAFPELRGGPAGGVAGAAGDIGVGLAIAGLWVGPYLLWPQLPRGEAFEPELFGPEWRGWVLALRLLGFAAVTPFMEELFVRSFLVRVIDTWRDGSDFRERPVARFTRLSFLGTLAVFTFSHAPWEWWVALPTGAVFNGWLAWRGHLGAAIRAHAVANAAIFALVVLGPVALYEFL
jgi:CAAX prenyl protease-like protein